VIRDLRGAKSKRVMLSEPLTLTLGVALWGAILSTILFALKIRDGWLDRPRLRITIRSGMKPFAGSRAVDYGTGTLLCVSVANIGRRPTTVECVSLLLPRGAVSRYVAFMKDNISCTYPVELTENQGHTFFGREDKLKEVHPLAIPDRYVIRIDTPPGHVYWSHGPLARRLKSRRWTL
jgi:hypothetical protein